MLCKHWLPASHNSVPEPHGVLESRALECLFTQLEPIKYWQLYACKVKAFLSIAADLYDGKIGREEDWKVLYPAEIPNSSHRAKFLLSANINYWLRIGAVKPQLDWSDEGNPQIQLTGYGLFGAMARQLAFAISRIEGFSVCSGCGKPFTPRRRAPKGRRSWCPACRKARADVRQAMRDYRTRTPQ